MKIEYSVNIMWCQSDGVYLATVPELPGCLADGETPEEAFNNLKIIAQEWVETAKEEKREIPKPLSVEDYVRAHQQNEQKLAAEIKQFIENTVSNAVKDIVQKERELGEIGFRSSVYSRGILVHAGR
jgi:predicted RNase H-like HicB family nuclease